jgi:hypothetical protein
MLAEHFFCPDLFILLGFSLSHVIGQTPNPGTTTIQFALFAVTI